MALLALAAVFVPLRLHRPFWIADRGRARRWLLGRVLRSSQVCHRNPLRSIAMGICWASLYTLPFVLGVALMHFAL